MMEFATTASPVASEVFASVALFVISVIVLLILRHYLPLRTTPAYLLVPIFFALCLPASMVLLVPIDLASSAMVDDIDARGIWLERGPLRICWRIAYWLTFCLTWYVFAVYKSSNVHHNLQADTHAPTGSLYPSSVNTLIQAIAIPKPSSETRFAQTPSIMPSSLAPDSSACYMFSGHTVAFPNRSRAPSWLSRTVGVLYWPSILWGMAWSLSHVDSFGTPTSVDGCVGSRRRLPRCMIRWRMRR